MGHVQPFVAIVLGDGSQQDAEQLARAAGATAILRPGQPHPVPLHAPDAVIDLAAPEHAGPGEPEDAVIDLAPEHVPEPAALIDLVDPAHSEQASPLHLPDTAVVIDPAEVLDVPALVAAVHAVLDRLIEVTPACVVAARSVTDTLKLVDGAGVLLGTADRDTHRWVSAPLAGPLGVLTAVAEKQTGDDHVAGRDGSPSVRPWLEALIEQGVEVQAVPV